MRVGRVVASVAGLALAAAPIRALETDQYYGWTRTLQDSEAALDEKINADLEGVLAKLNSRGGNESCPSVERAFRERFRYLIVERPELWAMNTSQLERIPADAAEEPRYRREYLYRDTSPLDPIRWMPPSPTIEVAGIRIGIDKLGHFLCDGAAAEAAFRRAREAGADEDDALERAMTRSLGLEMGIWGRGASGVFSVADLEADYEGLRFYRGLCEPDHPALVRSADGWRLKRPLALRDYVTPAWDESWQPNVYAPSRWARVEPVMRRYCGTLADPRVTRRRDEYAARDRETPVGALVRRWVKDGKLRDPRDFSIEAACGAPPSAARRGSSR